MNFYLKYFIICLVIIFLDIAWISLNFSTYTNSIQKIQKASLNLRYEHAIITYLIILFSIIYIAIPFTSQNIKNISDYTIENKLLQSFYI